MTDDRLRRWRLVLGGDGDGTGVSLGGEEAARDRALDALYGPRSGTLGGGAPSVARWLGDIRTYFSTPVVQVMQHDAIDRLGLREMLLEPELLGAVEPDVALVATLVALKEVIPARSRDTARTVVRRVTEQLEARLAERTRGAVTGALNRAERVRRPRPGDIDWPATIAANLRHYQPAYRTVVPERLVGYGRRRQVLARDVILCVDQSGSMAASVVYASVFASVLAGLRSLRTQLVVFDTNVIDLTDVLGDPVELLFATQLGGGTDINRAVAYCQGLVARPRDTVFILLSDLFEGGLRDDLLRRMAALARSGAVVVVLLALNDDGTPAYDHALAAALASVGVAAFGCTPGLFPDLMAAAIERRDLGRWAGERGLVTAAPVG